MEENMQTHCACINIIDILQIKREITGAIIGLTLIWLYDEAHSL